MVNRTVFAILCASLATAVSCGSDEVSISGRVLVDGAPIDRGTVRFEPVSTEGKGVGGVVEAGEITLSEDKSLVPGRYRVSATAFRKTGKTTNDYQRGAIDEMEQLTLRDSPQEIDISRETAGDLTLEFSTVSKK